VFLLSANDISTYITTSEIRTFSRKVLLAVATLKSHHMAFNLNQIPTPGDAGDQMTKLYVESYIKML
jgi:hypothetical protein